MEKGCENRDQVVMFAKIMKKVGLEREYLPTSENPLNPPIEVSTPPRSMRKTNNESSGERDGESLQTIQFNSLSSQDNNTD